jgi:hypothetical protein
MFPWKPFKKIDSAGLESGGRGDGQKSGSGSSRPKKSDFRIKEENEKIRKRFLQKLDQVRHS